MYICSYCDCCSPTSHLPPCPMVIGKEIAHQRWHAGYEDAQAMIDPQDDGAVYNLGHRQGTKARLLEVKT